MPYYDFLNEKTGEIKSLFFHMTEEKEFIDTDGYKWVRQFSIPTASIDTKWDANDPNDFIEKTAKKRGSIGDLWDKSAELSKERERKLGKDPQKEKLYENYSKSRRGKLHPDLRKKKLKEKFANNKFIELDI